jgi:uncharacterized SAM-binding protein YcdF (DUF218 family)
VAEIVIRDDLRSDVETLWRYHDMGHELHPCDVGIGLGSHDLGVAVVAVDLFHKGMFPHLVFTGANSPTTVDEFPNGEAVHYREYAIENGVPAESVMVETHATNTAENIRFARAVLAEHDVRPRSVILMSRPYQQRRAFATCRKVWPEVGVLCASRPLTLDDYVTSIGDVDRVLNMLVGDTQRIEKYAERGFAIPQPMPDDVRAAFRRLVDAGFSSRLV